MITKAKCPKCKSSAQRVYGEDKTVLFDFLMFLLSFVLIYYVIEYFWYMFAIGVVLFIISEKLNRRYHCNKCDFSFSTPERNKQELTTFNVKEGNK